MDYDNPDFSSKWHVRIAARYLLGPSATDSEIDSLCKDMNESELLGELQVELTTQKISIIHVDIRMVKPRDVIAWAYAHEKPVSPACAAWFEKTSRKRLLDCTTDDEKVELLSRTLNPDLFNLAKQKFMAAGISDHQRQIADKNPKHQFTRKLKEEARTLWAERRQEFKSKGQFSQWFVEYIWKRYPDKLKELRLEIQEDTVAYEWIKGL